MGVPKKDRFNDNWYGIRKREWYGVILRLTVTFRWLRICVQGKLWPVRRPNRRTWTWR